MLFMSMLKKVLHKQNFHLRKLNEKMRVVTWETFNIKLKSLVFTLPLQVQFILITLLPKKITKQAASLNADVGFFFPIFLKIYISSTREIRFSCTDLDKAHSYFK